MAPAMVAALNEAYSQQLEAMQSVDRSVAAIEDELEATGQLDNTVIVFTTDNGLFFGEHRIAAGKYAPYTAASHLPLVVAGPGFGTDVTDESPRLNTDLAPTLLDLAGAAAGRDMDGVSLRQSVAADRPLLLEGRMPFKSGGVAYRVSQFSAVRSTGWFYARYRYTDGTLDVELYDLASDPAMLINRHGAPGYRSREAALRSAMEGLAEYVVDRR
jgi:arylsulfatase A-like enzyme